MIRGIERRKIFLNRMDHEDFLDRLAILLPETKTACYAWALLHNHAHFPFRTGAVPLARLMRRLLIGYAVSFNLWHKRHGHLFQNRYKSIICQEDAYLRELVRYIHLNPVRAGIVVDVEELRGYSYSGHSALMGKRKRQWQDVDFVLRHFGESVRKAKNIYESYVKEGVEHGRRGELTGGGLIRSLGGLQARRPGLLFSSHRSCGISLKQWSLKGTSESFSGCQGCNTMTDDANPREGRRKLEYEIKKERTWLVREEERVYEARDKGFLSRKRKRFRLIDVFAGAGGLTLGFSKMFGHAFDSVWANDFDDACVRTYRKNFGDHCVSGDIVDILNDPATQIPRADVVIGGPPCQGFSLLNKKREGDPRKQLWRPFLDIV